MVEPVRFDLKGTSATPYEKDVSAGWLLPLLSPLLVHSDNYQQLEINASLLLLSYEKRQQDTKKRDSNGLKSEVS